MQALSCDVCGRLNGSGAMLDPEVGPTCFDCAEEELRSDPEAYAAALAGCDAQFWEGAFQEIGEAVITAADPDVWTRLNRAADFLGSLTSGDPAARLHAEAAFRGVATMRPGLAEDPRYEGVLARLRYWREDPRAIPPSTL